MPFEVPESWEWTTIGEIASSILYGVSESAKEKGTYKLLRITDIQNNKVNWETVPFTDYDNNKAQAYLLNDGDILFARTGATVGKSYLVEGLKNSAIYASYLIRVQTSSVILPAYIKFFFESGFYWEQISLNSVGIGQPNVNGTTLAALTIPIPPYREQLRIVEEAKKWLMIIDGLDVEIDDLQTSIEHTKSMILDLAVHGKIVPQNPNDEPAIELLKRINPSFVPCDNGHDTNKLPSGWEKAKLKEICQIIMGSSPSGENINSNKNGVEFHQGKLFFTDLYLNTSNTYTDSVTKLAPKNSILLCVRAPVGIVNISSRSVCIGRGLCAIVPQDEMNLMFLFYAIQTLKPFFEENATGTTFKAIGGDIVRESFILLPPPNEQLRIVAKIEEIFAILDEIQKSIED